MSQIITTPKGVVGFTLVELLVVLAIISLLAAVTLASVSTARQRARDGRRVSDIQQLKLALALYYNSQITAQYPVGGYAGLTAALVPVFMTAVPQDPTGAGRSYRYCRLAASPNTYNLGASLESASASAQALRSDRDQDVIPCLGGDTIDGIPDNDNIACDGVTAGECYDITP